MKTGGLSRPAWPILLPLLFGVVVVAFGGATLLSESRAAAIDRYATEIADQCAPATEQLSEARRELVHLRAQLRDAIDVPGPETASGFSRVDDLYDALDSDLLRYERLVSGSLEQAATIERIHRANAALRAAVLALRQHVAHREGDSARVTLNGAVTTSSLALDDALAHAVELNADRSHVSAGEIRRHRSGSARLALWLDAVSAAVALAAAVLLQRAMRSHATLLTELQNLTQERATELDAFSGRVAHDIRGPLNVITLSFDLAALASPAGGRTAAIARGQRAVERIKRLVDGLLVFARAGGQSQVGAQTEIASVVADVVDQLHDAADTANAELRVELEDDLVVMCAPGVLTSMIFNLAANAIKFLGAATQRCIVIRASREESMVRLAVEDAGPGFPPGMRDRIFEPFVRGVQGSRDGVGLGLATVRRFAEACGGSAGGENNAEAGCTFWVLLPTALLPRRSYADRAALRGA